MKKKTSKEHVGIIIGRFQTYKPHLGHMQFIEYVCKQHPKVIIFLGVAQLQYSKTEPLNFNTRKAMLLKEFPNVEIYPLLDCEDDYEWSNVLDNTINSTFSRWVGVKLYGGEDSFIKHYHGRMPTEVFRTKIFQSATNIRNATNTDEILTEDGRKGCIFTTQQQYTRTDFCIDVLVHNKTTDEFLLGKKSSNNGLYRFIGGYFDPEKDKDPKDTVRRELYEEAGPIEISDITIKDSAVINDWRYKGKKEKLVSNFYIANYVYGTPQPGDDLDGLVWVPKAKFFNEPQNLIPEHRVFLKNIS